VNLLDRNPKKDLIGRILKVNSLLDSEESRTLNFDVAKKVHFDFLY
jgi:hypothetical protein